MIVCTRCSKENQDHYKFCLGCGSELPRDAAPKVAAVPAAAPTANASLGNGAFADAIASDRQAVVPEKSLEFARTHQGDDGAEVAAHAAASGVGGVGGVGGVAGAGGGYPGMPAAAGAALGGAGVPNVASAQSPAAMSAGAMSAGAMSAGAMSAGAMSAGARAPNSCPACGNPVPVDFKFCGTCGHRMPAAGQAPMAVATPRAQAELERPGRGSLVVINPDGTEGSTFSLLDGTTTVGRNHGAPFSADAYLSPTHATFTFQGSGCTVNDEDSLNGVYVKLRRDVPVRLSDGDVFRIGQELIRFQTLSPPQLIDGVEPMGSPNPGYVGRIALVVGRESYGNGYPVPPDGIHLGRERGDVIFPEDGYVSGLHCRIHYDGAHCVLTDVGSSNGTFLRVRGSRGVVSGDLLLMGQQLFRLQF